MDWAERIFVRNARLYELVLEGMWERGEEDAVALSSYLAEGGLARCKVLDVPCGIGRVGIPLARLGFAVTGLDISPHLLEVARAKASSLGVAGRATFVRSDMHELDSALDPASFDAAICVFTSIGYGSEEDDLVFLRAVRKVVRRGGLFLLSGLRNRDYIARNPSQNVYEESRRLLVLDTYRFDPRRSTEEGSWRFYLKRGDVLRFAGEFPTRIRIYSPKELSSLLSSTGWGVLGTFETFTSRRASNPRSPVYAVAARAT
jgi:SAM-dependent methyltransferase